MVIFIVLSTLNNVSGAGRGHGKGHDSLPWPHEQNPSKLPRHSPTVQVGVVAWRLAGMVRPRLRSASTKRSLWMILHTSHNVTTSSADLMSDHDVTAKKRGVKGVRTWRTKSS